MKLLGIFNVYGLLIGIGIWAAYEVSRWYAKRIKVEEKLVDQGLLWAIIPGIVGSRLYHVIDLWEELYQHDPLQIIKVWEGGLGIFGGIIGGILGIVLFSYLRKKELFQILDIAAIGVPLGQAIGRWGNFFNGELYGRDGEPLFLYESVANFMLFIFLVTFVNKSVAEKRGVLFGTYLIGYGTIRLFLETLRPEAIIWTFSGIPVAQVMATVGIVGGSFIVLKRS